MVMALGLSVLLFAVLKGAMALFGIATPGAGPVLAEQELADLQDLEQLRSRFNDDRGVPRLLLVLSPT
jgi:hypothetical protein